jgi:hypothetical protein
MAELTGPNPHVRPQLDPGTQRPYVAFAGHSLGGVVSMRLAATTSTAPVIPRPQAIALHEASTDIWADPVLFPPGTPSTTSLLPGIAASTHLFAIRAETPNENDYSVPAYAGTPQIPLARKNFLRVLGDTFGNPDLMSDHFSPNQPPLDAMDWWGYWRPSEGAFNVAFNRVDRNEGYLPFCNADGPACDVVRNMGTWLNSTRAVTLAKNAGDLNL